MHRVLIEGDEPGEWWAPNRHQAKAVRAACLRMGDAGQPPPRNLRCGTYRVEVRAGRDLGDRPAAHTPRSITYRLVLHTAKRSRRVWLY